MEHKNTIFMRTHCLFFIFFFIWTPMDAQNGAFYCSEEDSNLGYCLKNNSTTYYDELVNSAILNKIKGRYSITTHKLILCTSVSTFIAVIDKKGERYIFYPSAAYLDELKNKDWKVTGEFLHAIAHLKSGDTNSGANNEINADNETAEFLKLAGATYEQAILHLDDIGKVGSSGGIEKSKRINLYRKVYRLSPVPPIDKSEPINELKLTTTENYFLGLLDPNSNIVTHAKTEMGINKVISKKDVEILFCPKATFAAEIFTTFATTLNLATFDENYNTLTINMPQNIGQHANAIRVLLGQGTEQDKKVLYGLLTPSQKARLGNPEKVSSLDFNTPYIQATIWGGLIEKSSNPRVKLFGLCKKWANSIARMADTHGNASLLYEDAISDNDVELTYKNIAFVSKFIIVSGLGEIGNPSQLQNWLYEQEALNKRWNTFERIWVKESVIRSFLNEKEQRQLGDTIGIIRENKPEIKPRLTKAEIKRLEMEAYIDEN